MPNVQTEGHLDSLYQDEEKADFNDHSSLLLSPQLCKLRAAAPVMLFYSLLHLDAQCGALALPVGSEDDRMATGS